MVSGHAPVVNGRKNKWRHAWLVIPVLVILAVCGSVYALSNSEPSYDVNKAVFHEGHLYANFKPARVIGGDADRYVAGTPVVYDTLWGSPTRAAEFTDDDGTTYGDCVGGFYPGDSFNPWLNPPYRALICKELP